MKFVICHCDEFAMVLYFFFAYFMIDRQRKCLDPPNPFGFLIPAALSMAVQSILI